MTVFHEVDFPFPIALGARGGPQRRTEIVTLRSGREERNTPWADSRRRWDVGGAIRSLDAMQALIAFFEARRGPLHGFRFRDPFDHKSCLPSQEPGPFDQVIGTGDGARTVFPLVKTYGDGPDAWQRVIRKPVEASIRVAVDGAETPVQLDAATGEIELVTAPLSGQVVTAGFRFDCPARFEQDHLDLTLAHLGAADAVSIPLIELRLD